MAKTPYKRGLGPVEPREMVILWMALVCFIIEGRASQSQLTKYTKNEARPRSPSRNAVGRLPEFSDGATREISVNAWADVASPCRWWSGRDSASRSSRSRSSMSESSDLVIFFARALLIQDVDYDGYSTLYSGLKMSVTMIWDPYP